MNLVRAEWSRLFHRRVTLVAGVAMLGVLALLVIGFGATSRQPTGAELHEARVMLAESQQDHDRVQAQCAARPKTADDSNCYAGPAPQLDDFLPYEFSFRRQIVTLLYLATAILGLVGFILGASFLGVEWSSGGMTNLLLWRPHREAVLASKFAVAVAGVGAIAVSYLVVWVAAFWLLGLAVGTVGTMGTATAGSVALLAARILTFTLLLALAGAALATLGRRTSVALGAVMGYLLVFELATFIILNLLRSTSSGRFRLSTYAAALLLKEVTLRDPRLDTSYTVTWVGGLVVLLLVVGVLTGAAFAVVRARDVT